MLLNKEMMSIVERAFPTFYTRGHKKSNEVDPLLPGSELLRITALPEQCGEAVLDDLTEE
jgi:hypothetical protein